MFASFRRSVELARHYPDLYFVGLLTLDDIRSAFGAATVLGRSWIYNPLITITVFLTQCLSPDHSCREAVSKLIAWRVRNQMKPCLPVRTTWGHDTFMCGLDFLPLDLR